MRRRSVWRTTTFRLTAVFMVVFVAGTVLSLGFVYVQTASYLTRRVDGIIAADFTELSRSTPEALPRLLQEQAARQPLTGMGLFSETGQQVAGRAWLTPAQIPPDGAPRTVARTRDHPPQRALAGRLPWGEVLLVQRDTSQITELRLIVLRALLVSGALIVGLGLGAAVTLGLPPLRRIQAMREASAAIAAGDLHARLPLSRGRDELDELAGIVNRMVGEIERLVTQARTVGEGVAHELRTPLTRLRATLDHAARDLPPDDPQRAALDRCLAETDGVLARFRALLRIAAVEQRSRRSRFAPTDLHALTAQVGELYAPLAADKDVALDVAIDGPATVPADAELLAEALSNLLDNAVKFTPSGGRVRLALQRGPNGPVIQVADDGPGLAAAEHALVVQRFYRSPATAQAPGHGLGLSLVAAVAELHGARLEFDDAAPGLIVRLVF